MTPRAGPFWHKDHNLNKLGRGPLDNYIPNIKALELVVSDKKIFSCFPYISLCKTYDPCVGPFFVPGA